MDILEFKTFITKLINQRGLSEFWSESAALIFLLSLILILGGITFWITRKVIMSFFIQISAKTKSKFDDTLIKNKVPKILSNLNLFNKI